MHSGSSISASDPAVSISVGIASLILEGRPLSDDDFINPDTNASVSYASHRSSNSSESVQDAHRLKQKLLQLRSCPGTSKDVIDCPIAVDSIYTTPSADEDFDGDEELYDHYNNKSDGTFLDSLQTLATTCIKTTPRSFNRTINVNKITSISNLNFHANKKANNIKSYFGLKSSLPSASSSSNLNFSSTKSQQSALSLHQALKNHNQNHSNTKKDIPKQGPHCETFLKKIGIIKILTTPVQNENLMIDDDHVCNEIINKICRKWNFNMNQIKSILTHGEPICIEVYLGPEINPILMEQWIIQLTDKPTYPTMTLQSLCSAIRSQLYFSQISSWTDLLKRQSHDFHDNNPRVKTHFNKKSHLDIIYRIKSYKSVSSSFSDKPNIHHFPDAIISDNYAVKVCLKNAKRFDNIPKSEIDFSSMSSSMIVDDHRGPCNEKGKHRCLSNYDEETLNEINETIINPTSSNSHRERQLLKYKKRLLKREKKKKNGLAFNDEHNNNMFEEYNQNFSIHASINSIRPPLYITSSAASTSSSSSSPSSIDHIITTSTQTATIEMMSVSTQTEYDYYQPLLLSSSRIFYDDDVFLNFPTCDFCGNDMQCICWNCDNKLLSNNNNNLGNGDLLLQSIQRTTCRKNINNNNDTNNYNDDYRTNFRDIRNIDRDKLKSRRDFKNHPENQNLYQNHDRNPENYEQQKTDRISKLNYGNQTHQCNNIDENCHFNIGEEYIIERSTCDNLNNLDLSDCRLCIKRQKTKHNYNNSNTNNKISLSINNNFNNYRRTMSESLTEYFNKDDDKNDLNDDDDINSFDRFDHKNGSDQLSKSSSPLNALSFEELKNYRRAFSEDVIDSIDDNRIKSEKKTPCKCNKLANRPSPLLLSMSSSTSSPPINDLNKLNESQKYKNAAPIFIKCTSNENNSIPKLNLSPVFDSNNSLISSPTAIEPVQKIIYNNNCSSSQVFNSSLYSPTLLSPRFHKQAAIFKRRSRHLSDRSSERSSIGSEEHISDEELGCGLDNTFSPIPSPNKNILRGFHNRGFDLIRRPLLGTLEESLLQNRCKPKYQVQGFKVLLGASGGFCPTQLTIPAVTNLYEFQGATFSTPYVCEMRLPRKGYSIPITGTVQTTLLNPQGTVVRMFVVPYDFRDMPNMSTTFIRQRILTYDEKLDKTGKSLEKLSNSEQMKYLRYAIHLRFQRSRSGRLSLHTDIKLLISRRTDCDTAAAHAKGLLELPNELKTVTIVPENPKYSSRIDKCEKKSTF